MRESLRWASTLVGLLILAGCGSTSGGSATPAGGSPPTGSSSAAPSAGSSPPSSSPPSSPAAGAQPSGSTNAPGASADPENPTDLMGAPFTITGTVRTSGSCVQLDDGTRRWALLGPAATKLHAGDRLTVRGRRASPPPGCDAPMALTVLSSSPD
jgi:hypothetical protein